MLSLRVPLTEIDVASAGELRSLLAGCDAAADLVVDLGDVVFCDSTGIRAFIQAHHRHVAAGGSVRLVNLQPPVQRIFTMMGLNPIFAITDPDT